MNEMSEFDYIVSSPLGPLGLCIRDESIATLRYIEESVSLKRPRNGLGREVYSQLQAYFKGPNFEFDLPLAGEGTVFQKRVWKQLCKIKPGATQTYGQVASKLRSGPRAVGNACRHNPIVLVVPCHRVVRADGLGGYAGRMGINHVVARKRWLLEHEGSL